MNETDRIADIERHVHELPDVGREDVLYLLSVAKNRSYDTATMQDDLRDLLDALGLFSGARPQSPHEVMRECIVKVKELRAQGGVLR